VRTGSPRIEEFIATPTPRRSRLDSIAPAEITWRRNKARTTAGHGARPNEPANRRNPNNWRSRRARPAVCVLQRMPPQRPARLGRAARSLRPTTGAQESARPASLLEVRRPLYRDFPCLGCWTARPVLASASRSRFAAAGTSLGTDCAAGRAFHPAGRDEPRVVGRQRHTWPPLSGPLS
jgi:hypothetical protein